MLHSSLKVCLLLGGICVALPSTAQQAGETAPAQDTVAPSPQAPAAITAEVAQDDQNAGDIVDEIELKFRFHFLRYIAKITLIFA